MRSIYVQMKCLRLGVLLSSSCNMMIKVHRKTTKTWCEQATNMHSNQLMMCTIISEECVCVQTV